MIDWPISLSKELIQRAKAASYLREKCKIYLKERDLGFDKFTIVSHDSFTGFLSEYFMKAFFLEYFKNSGIRVGTWEENFDIREINRILSTNSRAKEDEKYIKDFFYDPYDLQLSKKGKHINIDIKTALTHLIPTKKWNFLYPVVQAHKKGKDLMILAYYVVEDIRFPESLKRIMIAGFMDGKEIIKCKKIRKGEKTRYGTISQIDNYITQLKDYNPDLKEIQNYFNKRE